jgi:hypothetical protein
MFPVLLGSEIHFLSEQYNFEDIGRVLLFSLGIYTFDLMIRVLYSLDGHIDRIFIVQILGSITVCILAVSLTINTGLYNIYLFLFVGISIGYMKALTLYISDAIKKDNCLKPDINRRLVG